MRDSLKSRVTWSSLGWVVPLAFLALPDCDLVFSLSEVPSPNVQLGDLPHSSTIFCDIEDKGVERRCATPNDIRIGVPMSQAALFLTKGLSSNVGLDYSPAARGALGCSDGPPVQPVAVTFKCAFPDGCSVCLNCGGVIGPVYSDVNAACTDKCLDLNEGNGPPTPEAVQFCGDLSHSHASTNAGACFDGACTDAGSLRTDFDDPRRHPEPVIWGDVTPGVDVTGPNLNSLVRMAAASGQFDLGAASTQLINGGDGSVEFTAIETDKARACGLSSGAPPDGDPSLNDINFAVRLSPFGEVFIVENGAPVDSGNPGGSFTTYQARDRIRVTVTDRFDGTADIKYFLIPAGCAGVCDGMLLRSAGPAAYPFRVDASILTQFGTLTRVRLVRIK